MLQGTFLVIQWLRLQAPTAGNLGLIPSQGTRSHMPQLRICIPQLKRSQVLQLRPTAAKREKRRYKGVSLLQENWAKRNKI